MRLMPIKKPIGKSDGGFPSFLESFFQGSWCKDDDDGDGNIHEVDDDAEDRAKAGEWISQ